MDLPFYKYHKVKQEEEVIFQFYSVVENTKVLKAVTFTSFGLLNFYNVALADVLENGALTDIKTTKDFDRDLILTTVVRIMLEFFYAEPFEKLSFRGNTPAKTRLYRMALSIHFEGLSEHLKA